MKYILSLFLFFSLAAQAQKPTYRVVDTIPASTFNDTIPCYLLVSVVDNPPEFVENEVYFIEGYVVRNFIYGFDDIYLDKSKTPLADFTIVWKCKEKKRKK